MNSIGLYKDFAASAISVYIRATSIRKLPPIVTLNDHRYMTDPVYKQYFPYLVRLRENVSDLKNWSNRSFKDIAAQWDLYNRQIFLTWKKYARLAGKKEGLTGFLAAYRSLLATRAPAEWAQPAVATITRLENEIKVLLNICGSTAQSIRSGKVSRSLALLDPILLRVQTDFIALQKLIESDDVAAREAYDKKVQEIRDRIAASEKRVLTEIVEFEEGRYVTYDGRRPVPSFVSYERWKELVIPVEARVKRLVTLPAAIASVALWFPVLIAACVAGATRGPAQEALDNILKDSTQLAKLLNSPFLSNQHSFVYQCTEQWLSTVNDLAKNLWLIDVKILAMLRTYSDKLSEIRQTLKWLSRSLRSKQVLSSSEVAKVDGLIRRFSESWEFDVIMPALHTLPDQIGTIKVGDLKWSPYFLKMTADGAPT